MNELTDVMYQYVDREGMIDPAEMWSEEDLRKLMKAIKAELRRRSQIPTTQPQEKP